MENSTQNGERRSLTPEERALLNKKLQMKRKFRLAIVIAGFVLVAALIISPIIIFAGCKVKVITPVGESVYSSQEIVDASGIEIGKNLFSVNLKRAGKNIEEALPYIENVTVKRKLPKQIIIRFDQNEPTYVFSTSENIYVVTNGSLKVLEKTGVLPENLTVIKGVMPVKHGEGEIVSFLKDEPESSDSNENEDTTTATEEKEKTDVVLGIVKDIVESLQKAGWKDIDEINLTSISNIYLVYQKRMILKLGDPVNIENKLSLARKVIDREDGFMSDQFGTINLTVNTKAYFSAADPKNIEELAEYLEHDEEPNEDGEDGNSDNGENDNDNDDENNGDADSDRDNDNDADSGNGYHNGDNGSDEDE